MTTEETIAQLGTFDWDESEAPMMLSSTSAISQQYDVLLEGTPAAEHMNSVGGASKIADTVRVKHPPLAPPLVKRSSGHIGGNVASCPLLHALRRVIERGERFSVADAWSPCWYQFPIYHSNTAAVCCLVTVSCALNVWIRVIALICTVSWLCLMLKSRHVALTFGGAFEQFHSSACGYLSQLDTAVQHWEMLRDTQISRRKSEQVRKSIRHTSELTLLGLSKFYARVDASHTPHSSQDAPQLLYSLLMGLTALLLDDSKGVTREHGFRLELRTLALQLQASAQALEAAVAECVEHPLEQDKPRCEAWESFAREVSLLGAQVQLLHRSSIPDEHSVATLTASMQSVQRHWLRVHGLATAEPCPESESGMLAAEGEDWASGGLQDLPSAAAAAASHEEEPLLVCDSLDPSAEPEPPEPVAQLSRAEFQGRRLRVAAEMEAKLSAEPEECLPESATQQSAAAHSGEFAAEPLNEDGAGVSDGIYLHGQVLQPLRNVSRPMPVCRRPAASSAEASHLNSSKERLGGTAPSFMSELSSALSHHPTIGELRCDTSKIEEFE